MKKIFIVMAVIVLFCLSGVAYAVTVDYTVAGSGPMQYPASTTPPANAPWGVNGYPGDTLQFITHTGTLDLTPGSYVQKINTLLWTIDYTYGGTASSPTDWSNLSFNILANRNISFNTVPAGSLGQTGLLDVTWDNDFITLNDGPGASFIVQGYKVDITPLGFDQTGGSDFSSSNPWVQPQIDINARFDVSIVPEPSSFLALGGGLVTLLGIKRRRA